MTALLLLLASILPAPPGFTPVIDSASLAPTNLHPHASADLSHAASIVDSGHPNFETAIRAEIFGRPQNTWNAGIAVGSDHPVHADDTLLVGLWIRGVALDPDKNPIPGAGGVAEVVFEKRSEPFSKSLQFLIETPADFSWHHVWLPFKCTADFAAGSAGFSIQLGYLAQRIDVGGIEVLNYGDRSITDLPQTMMTYVGREPDAEWRAAADQRIERLRKCDTTVRIIDGEGNPIAGIEVDVEQTSHHFPFGSAISVEAYRRQDEDGQKYREHANKYFNAATIENSLKWISWDSSNGDQRDQTIEVLDQLRDAGMMVRGHVMVWPGFGNSPSWLSQLQDKPEAFRKVVETHIREMSYATVNHVDQWDVVNEAFDNTDFVRILGQEFLADAFKLAREGLPETELYYNDYAGLVRAGLPTSHKDHFEQTVDYLIANAPIDGIGIQGHFGRTCTPPERLLAELDKWGSKGLKMLITEYDVEVPDETLKADFTRDFLTVCFSHPDVDGVMTWGFWAGSHWKPEAALWDRQWNLTPAGKQWTYLTHDKWRTKLQTKTNDDGELTFRGFKGDYKLHIGDADIHIEAIEDGTQQVTIE